MISRGYQFPEITDEMYDKIKEFDDKVRGDNKYAGAIGGALTFKITPTSIGDFITVIINGEELDLSEV